VSDQRGTLDGLLNELGKVMAPLQTELHPSNAPGFFAELGIPLTGAQAVQIATPLAAVQDSLTHLLDIGTQLAAAVETDDDARIIELAIAGVARLGELIDGFATFSTALNSLSLPATVTPADVAAVSERLMNLLLVRYLSGNFALVEALELTGILERTDHNVDSTDPDRPFFTTSSWHFDRIGDWMSHPGQQLEARYGFGTPTFDGTVLLSTLDQLIAQLGYPVAYTPAPTPTLELIGLRITPKLDVTPRGLSVALASGTVSGSTQVGSGAWTIQLSAETDALSGTEVAVQPDGRITLTPPSGSPSGRVRATWGMSRPGAPIVVLGQPTASRLEMEHVSAYIETGLTWTGGHAEGQFGLGGEVTGGKAVIKGGQGDGFIQKILSGIDIEDEFSLELGYSTTEGLHFRGSSTLAILLASHIDLGPVQLTALTLTVGISPPAFPVGITTNIRADLGPLVGIVEGIGFEIVFTLTDPTQGDLGPLNVEPRFVPPRGAGLSLDVGAVKGGGYLYFDPDAEEYAGALELEILEMFSAHAVGLITTRLPGGVHGFSLLIIITVEFTPAFQLSWGFTLNAVGGLLGVNRTMNLDRLREGVRTNSISSVMFPQDVIANAPRIISDLRELFPPEEGRFLIGPMAKLGWGTPSLITLSLGVIIEIPGNIAIVGVLRIALPTDDETIVNLQVNFVGTLDFNKKMLTFDASLYESRILWITLEGDMAVRLKWGDDSAFLVSVGGFHPSFEPPPLELPSPMRRISCSILDTSVARIRVENYQAVTSNTVQFGARAELFFGFDDFNVDGYMGFDALFQFNPFKFVIDISAGLTLHAIGVDVLSIRLRMTLEGPSPWRARGQGSVSILFWDIDVDFDISWGEHQNTTLPSVPVLPQIVDDLSKPSHWSALPPPSSTRLWVALRPLDAADESLVLHPAGSLTVAQKVVPLDFTFDRVGTVAPADVNRASIASAASGAVPLALTPFEDKFARAQYKTMSDAEKLSSPSFEPFHAGTTLSASGTFLRVGHAVHREARYEITIVDKEPRPPFVLSVLAFLGSSLWTHMLGGSAVALAGVSAGNRKLREPYEEKVAVGSEKYVVAFTATNQPIAATAAFSSEAMAKDHLTAHVAANPGLAGTMHVVPAFEAAAA
jgi:hypothetical protein